MTARPLSERLNELLALARAATEHHGGSWTHPLGLLRRTPECDAFLDAADPLVVAALVKLALAAKRQHDISKVYGIVNRTEVSVAHNELWSALSALSEAMGSREPVGEQK